MTLYGTLFDKIKVVGPDDRLWLVYPKLALGVWIKLYSLDDDLINRYMTTQLANPTNTILPRIKVLGSENSIMVNALARTNGQWSMAYASDSQRMEFTFFFENDFDAMTFTLMIT